MVVEDKGIEKMYSFYVSEYHLEMILLPFINEKIEENKKVIIKTEYNLEESLKVLLKKVNIKEENKEKIFKLGWKPEKIGELENKSNIIIIGDNDYIKNTNNIIKEDNLENITIVDCYKFEELENDVNKIEKSYDCNLNTYGIKYIK